MGYLAFVIVAVTAFVFGLNWRFKSSPADSLPDVGFGQTTWTYYLELYFAPWNRYQPYLVCSYPFLFFPTKVGVLLGYILHHTRGKAVKVDPVVNVVLWQVNQLNQSQSYPPDLLPCFLCCRLWSARLEIWWTDHTFHGNCLQCFAGELSSTSQK